MTRKEALDWLHLMKWHLADTGHQAVAWEVEDAEKRLLSGFTKEQAREFSYFILDNGKRGHATLVLNPPYDARAMAMLVGILRSLD